jgi:phosphate starvation-inducible PhoH-like protein
LDSEAESCDVTLEPPDNERLARVCGQFDDNLRLIERRLGVEISNRGNQFRIAGDKESRQRVGELLQTLYREAENAVLTPAVLHLHLHDSGLGGLADSTGESPQVAVAIRTRRGLVRPRGDNQQRYLHNIISHDISFGVGPAGTGKTYLAVACAVDSLEREEVRRIVLVRPAVEAGERLGFLPGDMAQKIDPYLRPLYDALYEMLGFERVAKLLERNVIEVAPLAFMRGRTLNESFIILDEAQNTSLEQMKMFLTRIGFGSTAVVTGDVTQVDLPRGQGSGLRHALEVLDQVEGISFTFFTGRDVVRHPLIQRIVAAYDRAEKDD